MPVAPVDFRNLQLVPIKLPANICTEFYIHVTVHRNRFLFNNQPDALINQIYSVIKLYMIRAFSLPIIRPFPGRVRMERISILTLLGSGHQKPA